MSQTNRVITNCQYSLSNRKLSQFNQSFTKKCNEDVEHYVSNNQTSLYLINNSSMRRLNDISTTMLSEVSRYNEDHTARSLIPIPFKTNRKLRSPLEKKALYKAKCSAVALRRLEYNKQFINKSKTKDKSNQSSTNQEEYQTLIQREEEEDSRRIAVIIIQRKWRLYYNRITKIGLKDKGGNNYYSGFNVSHIKEEHSLYITNGDSMSLLSNKRDNNKGVAVQTKQKINHDSRRSYHHDNILALRNNTGIEFPFENETKFNDPINHYKSCSAAICHNNNSDKKSGKVLLPKDESRLSIYPTKPINLRPLNTYDNIIIKASHYYLEDIRFAYQSIIQIQTAMRVFLSIQKLQSLRNEQELLHQVIESRLPKPIIIPLHDCAIITKHHIHKEEEHKTVTSQIVDNCIIELVSEITEEEKKSSNDEESKLLIKMIGILISKHIKVSIRKYCLRHIFKAHNNNNGDYKHSYTNLSITSLVNGTEDLSDDSKDNNTNNNNRTNSRLKSHKTNSKKKLNDQIITTDNSPLLTNNSNHIENNDDAIIPSKAQGNSKRVKADNLINTHALRIHKGDKESKGNEGIDDELFDKSQDSDRQEEDHGILSYNDKRQHCKSRQKNTQIKITKLEKRKKDDDSIDLDGFDDEDLLNSAFKTKINYKDDSMFNSLFNQLKQPKTNKSQVVLQTGKSFNSAFSNPYKTNFPRPSRGNQSGVKRAETIFLRDISLKSNEYELR